MNRKISKEEFEIRKILDNDKNYVKETEVSMNRARLKVDEIEKEVLKTHNKISLLL